MVKNNKMIIYCDQDSLIRLLMTIPLILGIGFLIRMVFAINSTLFFKKLFFILFIILSIKVILCASFMLLIMGVLYPFFFTSIECAGAMLDEKGIWVRHFGFISWDNIAEFSRYQVLRNRYIDVIGIKLKDTSLVFRQADYDSKLKLVWAQLWNGCHIKLIDTNVDNSKIIQFAHQCMKINEASRKL